MANRVLTGYQVGLGVLCALGLGLAIWLTSTDPTITYSTPQSGPTEVVCSSGVVSQDDLAPETDARSYAITVDCARAERARLRTTVWVLSGVLAGGVVLMGTVIVRIGRRRR